MISEQKVIFKECLKLWDYYSCFKRSRKRDFWIPLYLDDNSNPTIYPLTSTKT